MAADCTQKSLSENTQSLILSLYDIDLRHLPHYFHAMNQHTLPCSACLTAPSREAPICSALYARSVMTPSSMMKSLIWHSGYCLAHLSDIAAVLPYLTIVSSMSGMSRHMKGEYPVVRRASPWTDLRINAVPVDVWGVFLSLGWCIKLA
jgi:hypothetical protein